MDFFGDKRKEINMFKKRRLEQKMEKLIDIIEKSNLREIIYILGSKKQIIIRNILARNIKRSRDWNTE